MKKIIFVLGLSVLLHVFGAGQNTLFAQNNQPQRQSIITAVSLTQQFEEFDKVYYDYAKKFLHRKAPLVLLDFYRDYRTARYTYSKTSKREAFPYTQYNEKLQELSKQYMVTNGEWLVIKQYANRPLDPVARIENTITYWEYEDIAYELADDQMLTLHAKTYLQQAKLLREHIVNGHTSIQEDYATLRAILDKKGIYALEIPDQMSIEERAVAEEFLQRTVAINQQEYTIPLDNFLEVYRENLSYTKRKNYPTRHYQ